MPSYWCAAHRLFPLPHRPLLRMMVTPEPQAVGDAPSKTNTHSEMISTLNADIQPLATDIRGDHHNRPQEGRVLFCCCYPNARRGKISGPVLAFQLLMGKHDQGETMKEGSFIHGVVQTVFQGVPRVGCCDLREGGGSSRRP